MPYIIQVCLAVAGSHSINYRAITGYKSYLQHNRPAMQHCNVAELQRSGIATLTTLQRSTVATLAQLSEECAKPLEQKHGIVIKRHRSFKARANPCKLYILK